MLISPALLPAIERIGWYEYNAFVSSDHRAGYIDFNTSKLFHNGITNTTYPATQKLRLHTIVRVEKYLQSMRYLFDSRQLLQLGTDLEETAREKRWCKDLEKNTMILTEK